jgi:hypothetical protein
MTHVHPVLRFISVKLHKFTGAIVDDVATGRHAPYKDTPAHEDIDAFDQAVLIEVENLSHGTIDNGSSTVRAR